MHRFPTKILLATDGSEDAALALHAAVDLSTKTGSELHVVHAWQAFTEYSHPSITMASDSALYEGAAQKILFEQIDEAEAAGGAASGLTSGEDVPPRPSSTQARSWRPGSS